MKVSLTTVLAGIALLLALLALVNAAPPSVALSLAVILLALAVLAPGLKLRRRRL